MTQVLWPQEAQWRLARKPADILDSPTMESIRKWFYRPKVSFFSSFFSFSLLISTFIIFLFQTCLSFFSLQCLYIVLYRTSYLIERVRSFFFFSFLVPVFLYVGPARCCHLFRENSHDIPKCFGRRVTPAWYTCTYVLHWYAHECTSSLFTVRRFLSSRIIMIFMYMHSMYIQDIPPNRNCK